MTNQTRFSEMIDTPDPHTPNDANRRYADSPFGYTVRPGHHERVEPTRYRMGLVLLLLLVPMGLWVFWYLSRGPAETEDIATSAADTMAAMPDTADVAPPEAVSDISEAVEPQPSAPPVAVATEADTVPLANAFPPDRKIAPSATTAMAIEETTTIAAEIAADTMAAEVSAGEVEEIAVGEVASEPMLLPAPEPGAEVAWVQERLQALGYRPGPVDGLWGQRTARALAAFQRAAGLGPSGVIDPSTIMALRQPAPAPVP